MHCNVHFRAYSRRYQLSHALSVLSPHSKQSHTVEGDSGKGFSPTNYIEKVVLYSVPKHHFIMIAPF